MWEYNESSSAEEGDQQELTEEDGGAQCKKMGEIWRAGVMTQQGRALTVLAEVLSLIPDMDV